METNILLQPSAKKDTNDDKSKPKTVQTQQNSSEFYHLYLLHFNSTKNEFSLKKNPNCQNSLESFASSSIVDFDDDVKNHHFKNIFPVIEEFAMLSKNDNLASDLLISRSSNLVQYISPELIGVVKIGAKNWKKVTAIQTFLKSVFFGSDNKDFDVFLKDDYFLLPSFRFFYSIFRIFD